MSIILPHTSIEFKKNEIKTLEYIQARGFFDNDFPELANVISTTFSRYCGLSWNRYIDFEFASDFEMEIEKKNRIVVLHGQVRGNFAETSYSIGICSNDGSFELIRRFHFDYVHDNGSSKQKVPISHLQYGGKSGSGFNGRQFLTNNIEHWLSEPRINCAPINLALLLDMTFCEFHNEQTEKIVENSDWRNLIKVNEIFMIGDYYNTITTHMKSQNYKKEKLVRDICYGV